VTGAATGLGRVTAILYAEEGARVVVADVREDEARGTVEEIVSAGGAAIFVRTDVSSSSDVQALIAAAESHYGKLDVMTANAAIFGRGAYKGIEALSDDEIEEIMAVDYFGVVWSLKYAAPAIRRAGGGAMTVTSSLAAHRGHPKLPIYASAKGAINALVMSLAVDLAPEIRVNAVSPGGMRTEIARHAAEAQGIAYETTPAFRAQRDSTDIADPRAVAMAHLFLVSDEASYVTGHALVADGGQMLR